MSSGTYPPSDENCWASDRSFRLFTPSLLLLFRFPHIHIHTYYALNRTCRILKHSPMLSISPTHALSFYFPRWTGFHNLHFPNPPQNAANNLKLLSGRFKLCVCCPSRRYLSQRRGKFRFVGTPAHFYDQFRGQSTTRRVDVRSLTSDGRRTGWAGNWHTR